MTDAATTGPLAAPMRRLRVILLTALAMLAFAANSVLCRMALAGGSVDPASFTALRLGAGAGVLGIWLGIRPRARPSFPPQPAPTSVGRIGWPPLLLFTYAAAFSFAYVRLSTGIGALILFGAVQLSMVGASMVWLGQRPGARALFGLLVSLGGLLVLVAPGLSRPDPMGALLMALAGTAWGGYSLLGRGVPDPTAATARSFVRAAPLGLLLAVVFRDALVSSRTGVALAVASGALASALGYALWYAALRGLRPIEAALVQLTVPVLAGLFGILWLGETPHVRLLLSGLAVLGGLALALFDRDGPPRR